MSKKLEGKVALVTGASKGIGAEIAVQLAEAGASVIVNYSSDAAGAANTVKKIEALKTKAVAVQANVSKVADVDKLFAEVDKAFGGKLDILVNNAGIFYNTPIDQVTAENFHDLFDTNVLSMFLVTKLALKRFPQSGGSVINISSLVATKGFGENSVYSATKGAIDSLTRVLAVELGPKKIRVNTINPGLVITEGTKTAGFAGSDFEKGAIAMSPLGRAGHPDDIASVAVFLASEDSKWMTGESLFATGGIR
jgi:3-oxoacyl-[acyl-carrier protein] reductase